MKSEGFLTMLAYFAKRLGIAEIIILVVTGLICWWLGWRTLTDYSTGLLWAGFVVTVFGMFSFFGGTSLGTDYSYQYSKTVMPNSDHNRAQQNVSDLAAGMSFATWAGIAGITTIALGYILRAFLA